MKFRLRLVALLFVSILLASQLVYSSEVGGFPAKASPSGLNEVKAPSPKTILKGLGIARSENSTHITMELTYTSSKPSFSKLLGYDVMSLEGCDAFVSVPGEPTLPVKTVCVLLPPASSNASVNVLEVKSETLLGDYLIFPAQEPAIDSESSDSRVLTKPDAVIYALSSEWPSRSVEVVKVGQMREYRILVLKVFPVKYVPSSRKVVLYSKIRFSVTFRKAGESELAAYKYSVMFEGLCEDLVVNQMESNSYNFASPPSEEAYKYVIITPSSFASAAKPLADWKSEKGVPAKVFTTEEIDAQYTGKDLVEKIRNFLKDAYDKWGIEWVLLCGDVDEVPIRMVYSPVGEGYDPYAPSDYYYADLTGNWDSNGNGKYGEVGDSVDWYPEVYVGRLPAQTPSELTTMVTKIINYEKNPPSGAWSRRTLFAGAFLNYADEDGKGYPETDTATVQELVRTSLMPSAFTFTRLYEKEGLKPSDYSCEKMLSLSNLQQELDIGYIYVMLGGHGAPEGMGRKVWASDPDKNNIPEENEMSWPTMISASTSLTNKDLLSFVYADSCLTTRIDYSSDTLAETMMKSPNGAIGYVGATRVSYYSVGWHLGWGGNQELDYRFWQKMFTDTATESRPGVALYASKLWYSNNYDMTDDTNRHNLFVYLLLGDPEMSVKATETVSDFSISASPVSQSVTQGDQATFTVTVTSSGTFESPVSLSLSNPIKGATYQFIPQSVTPSPGGSVQSNLTIITSASTPAGYYTLTVFCRSGILTRSAQALLVVNVAGPDFNMTASPTLMTVQLNGQGATNMTVSSINGFNAPVTLNVSSAPSGVVVGLTPSSVTPPKDGVAESTLSILVDATATPGTYTLTVTGTSDPSIHYCTVALTVMGERPYNLKINHLSSPSKVAKGQDFTVDITVGYSFAFDTNIFVGIWDYENETIVTGGTDTLSKTGIATYMLTLKAPETETLWSLAGVVLYWNGSDWNYDPSGWLWDFDVSVSGVVEHSVQVSTVESPSQVDPGKTFAVNVTIDYSFVSTTQVYLAIWDYGKGEYISVKTENLTGTGSKTHSFSLLAPSTQTVWSLSAVVFYMRSGQWLRDVGVWHRDFQVEVAISKYPDLAIKDAWVGDSQGVPIAKIKPGSEFYLWATVDNIGQTTAEDYYVTVYFNNSRDIGGPGNLEVDGETYWYLGPFKAETGSYEVRWVVNENRSVTETSYGNNEKTMTMQVPERPFLEKYGTLIAVGVGAAVAVAVVSVFFVRRRRAQRPPIVKRCPLCGADVPPEAVYCPNCGARVS